jgi:GT2 family glycosyltransferase
VNFLKSIQTRKTAIVILNWNSYEDTYECIKSLEGLDFKDFHVFLVDNNSIDKSFERLTDDLKKGKFKVGLTLIQTGDNLGFAGGNNVGIKEAIKQGFEFFWLLNNDTIVDPQALSSLVNTMDKETTIGIIGSKILYYGTNKIWFAGGKINRFTGETKHIGIGEEDLGQYNKLKTVDYITGCSLFFKAELINTTGLMCEDYFLYYEETDWNIRAKKDNWTIIYQPESVVYHKVSATVNRDTKAQPPYVNYYDIRNKHMMIKRNLKNKFINLYLIYDVCKKVVKIFLKDRVNRILRLRYVFHALKDIKNKRMGIHPRL